MLYFIIRLWKYAPEAAPVQAEAATAGERFVSVVQKSLLVVDTHFQYIDSVAPCRKQSPIKHCELFVKPDKHFAM